MDDLRQELIDLLDEKVRRGRIRPAGQWYRVGQRLEPHARRLVQLEAWERHPHIPGLYRPIDTPTPEPRHD